MEFSKERLVNKPVFLRDHELGRKGKKKRTNICEKTFELQGMDFTLSLFTYGGDVIEMIVQNDEVSFFLHIKNDCSDYKQCHEDIHSLRLNYNKVLELFKKIVANSELQCFGKHPFFEHEFIFLKAKKKRPTSKYVENGYNKRRRVDSNKFLFSDMKLGLRIKIIPQPDFILDPVSFHFEFITVPRFDIDPLPNEILLEIFRFLDSKFLILDVSFVNKKFHQLVESEFLYRHHHFKCLLSGFERNLSEKKASSVTWKEHTKRLIKTRIYFVLHDSIKNSLKTDGSDVENLTEKCRIFRKTDYDVVLDVALPTNIYVSPEESHTWVVRVSRSRVDNSDRLYEVQVCAVGFLRERSEQLETILSPLTSLGSYESYCFDFTTGSWWFDQKIQKSALDNSLTLIHKDRKHKELLLEISLDRGKMKIVVIEIDGEKPSQSISTEHEIPKDELLNKFSLAIDCNTNFEWEIISFKKNN